MGSREKKRKCLWVGTALLFAATSILVLAELALYSQNTLLHNGSWIIGKRMMQMAVIDDDELLYNRVPLAGNRLNLGSWYGFQRIVSREVFDPAEVRFTFKPSANSYVSLLMGESESGFFAVRLSNLQGVPSAVLKAGADGDITILSEIMLSPKESVWSEASAEIQGGDLIFRVDRNEVFRGHLDRAVLGRIGLWGSYAPVLVSRLDIRRKDGTVFSETFANSRFISKYVTLATLFVLLVWGATFLFDRGRARGESAYLRWFESGTMSMATLALIAGIGLFFDWSYWSFHPGNTLRWGGAEQFAPWYERARFEFFHAIASRVGDETSSHHQLGRLGYPLPDERIWHGPIYCGKHEGLSAECVRLSQSELKSILDSPKRGPRILFSGSSQTLGCGASRLEKTFFADVYSELKGRLSSRSPEMLNIGVAGDHVEPQFHQYEEIYSRFHADLTLLNWSTNDSATDLDRGLGKFLESISRGRGHALLVLEPNSSECGTNIAEKHQIVRKLSETYEVPLFDLQATLLDPEIVKRGFAWWDFVHLTDLGQRLVAEQLAPRIAELLSRGP